jgi:peptide deformylase
MALLPILHYPDPRLHKVAEEISHVDGNIRQLIKDMAQTMYATQVDVHKRLIIVDVSESRDQLKVFINPKIIEASGESDCEEGCLSVPGIYETVRRAERIKVRALDQNGEPFTLEAEGLLAVCIQHEMDHLVGKVFVERLSRLKQQRIMAKLRKQARVAM